MKFLFKCLSGKEFSPEQITSFELSGETSAACWGLRINFICEKAPEEIVEVKAFADDKMIFSGYCDMQRATCNSNGISVFVYARSSACLLVDNEALPCEYYMPTSRQLWIQNGREFGFEYGLPNLTGEGTYRVLKGTSRFGAINDFVCEIHGRGIYVSPDGIIKAYEMSRDLKSLPENDIISASFTYKRSSVLSAIDYKIDSGEKYKYHLESVIAKENNITRKKLINLSSLPSWQRKARAKRQIQTSLKSYTAVEISLSGIHAYSLYDRIFADLPLLDACGEYFVDEIVYRAGANGFSTSLILRQKAKEEFNNYVA